jgi:hypothetical protein
MDSVGIGIGIGIAISPETLIGGSGLSDTRITTTDDIRVTPELENRVTENG